MPSGSTTSRPSGLAASLASFATLLDGASPTDAVRPPVTSDTVRRNAIAVCSGSSSSPARSAYASSMLTCCTTVLISRRACITAWLAVR